MTEWATFAAADTRYPPAGSRRCQLPGQRAVPAGEVAAACGHDSLAIQGAWA
jgi:hypothetical protein